MPKTFRMLNVSSKFAICGLPVRVDTSARGAGRCWTDRARPVRPMPFGAFFMPFGGDCRLHIYVHTYTMDAAKGQPTKGGRQ